GRSGGRWRRRRHSPRRREGSGTAGRSACSGRQQLDEGLVVDLGEQVQIAGAYTLVHLVDGGVDRAQLHHLGAQGGDEAAIGGAAAGGGGGFQPRDLADAGRHGVQQFARLGQEGQAGQRPVDAPVQAVPVENGGHALLEAFLGGFGAEAEVEHHLQLAGDHVGGAGAAVNVGDLEAGRREVGVAVVPVFGGQFGQRRGGQVDRVLRQVRVGHVALLAAHGQHAAQGAAPAVLHHVAQALGA